MDQAQPHQPRLCQEAEFMKVVRPGPTDSPPPNCAICLGMCTNKCFTDCCLHQFCFSCLLEWSKIKAECPLCKQPFKSIIYNIKSNLEYEEHVITNPEREVQGEDLLLDEDIDVRTEYLFLPNGPRPQRHFQYRTTFTLEPGGEFAIQQLLLAHPRTNSIYLQSDRFLQHRLNQHSIHQRRSIYSDGLWAEPLPDLSGRYRECTPSFFRENPAQIHRIVPWLNRELSALLIDYIDIYQVQERILEMLPQYSIQSASFRNRIASFIGNRTDHFIHELYNYVRSTYDMIGYDRHATYSHIQPVVYSHSVSDDDSDDVRVIDLPSNDDCIYVPPRTSEVIVINSDTDSDSDIIVNYPPTPPIPPIVNLIDSESDDNVTVTSPQQPTVENIEPTETNRSPQLPIKMRYKRNRNSTEVVNSRKLKDKRNNKMKWYDSTSNDSSDSDSYQPKSDSEYSTAHISTSTSSSSSSSSSSSDISSSSSSSNTNKKYVKSLILKRVQSKSRKRKNSYKAYKTSKYRNRKATNTCKEGSPERFKAKKRKSSKQKKSKRRSSDSGYHHRSKRLKRIKMERSDSSQSERDTSSDEGYRGRKKPLYTIKKESNYSSSDEYETKYKPEPELTQNETSNANEQSELDRPQDLDVAGPSRGPSLRSVIVRGNNKWYSRPELEDTTTDNNSD